MSVAIRPLDTAAIHQLLARRKASRAETEATFRRVAEVYPGEHAKKILDHYDSGRAEAHGVRMDSVVVESLKQTPKERLLTALAYWIPIQENDTDEDTKQYSMLPWLLRIQEHLGEDDLTAAFLEMRDMEAALGGTVPDGLSVIHGDEWCDVIFS